MQDTKWGRVSEDKRTIKIETDKLEAVIPKKNPKHDLEGYSTHGSLWQLPPIGIERILSDS